MEIQTQQELIKNLAQQGDPTAFFTLLSPYLRKRYLKERIEGKEHREVLKKVIYETVEYFSEIQHLTPEKFNHWIEEKFTESSEPTLSSNEEEFNIENEKKINTEVDAFLSRCHRELIRASGIIKKNRIAERRKFPQILYYNKILRNILIFLSFVIIALGGIFIMYWKRVSIKISIAKENEEFSFAIPPFYKLTKEIKEDKVDSLKSFDTLQERTQIVKINNPGEKLTESKIFKKDSSFLSPIRKTTSPSTPTSSSLLSTMSSTSTQSAAPSQKKTLSSSEQSSVSGTVTTSSSYSRSLETTPDTTSRRMSIQPSPPSTIPSSSSPTTPPTEQSTSPSSLQSGN